MITTRPSTTTAALVAGGVLTGTLLSMSPVAAHTGHGTSGIGAGLLHPVAGPDHLLAMVAVGIVAALVGSRRTAILTPVGFLLGMTLGGALAMGSVTLGGTEMLIGASVMILGILCVVQVRRDTVMLPIAAVAFGLFHGQAHGAELPSGASPLAYVTGFLVTTAALHLAGGCAGLALRRSGPAKVLLASILSGAGLAVLLGV